MIEYSERKIKEIESKIDNTIVRLNMARCMAIDVPYHIAVYDGKCWNQKIEDEINKKLVSTYDGCCLETDYDVDPDYTFRIYFQGVPYILPVLYIGNDKSMYTKAHNYRIDVKDIQAQAGTFIAKCDELANELKTDKKDLISVISQYQVLLTKAEQLSKKVAPFTRETIIDAKLFSRPVYSFF